MSAPPTIAKISATAAGGEFSPQGLRISLRVNQVATASMNVSRNADQIVQSPLSSDLLTYIAEKQKKRLAGKPEPDVNITAEDGRGGSINFTGYLTAPVVEITKASVADTFTVLGEDGILDALDLGIYWPGYKTSRSDSATSASGVSLKPLKPAKTGNVTQLLSEFSDVLVGNLAGSLRVEEHESTKKLLNQQHEINIGEPMKVWKAILNNNSVTYETWAAAAEKNEELANLMTERCSHLLAQKGGGFWSTLHSLMATFQMYYVPATYGSGYLDRADKKVGEPTRTIEASATRITLSDGSHKLLPPGGVVMMTPCGEPSRPDSASAPKMTMMITAQYPEELLYGFIQREVPPLWLLRANGRPILGSKIDKSKTTKSKELDLSIDGAKERHEEADTMQAENDEKIGSVMEELCEVMFKEIQLAHSTASISLPLDLSIGVGERATINIPDGGSFTGFVNEVTHSVDLRSGKELNSFTDIGLTHVEY